MTVLVTGATGFIGRALCAELSARGVQTRGAVRPGRSVAGVDNVVVPDITCDTDWSQALRGIDVVIHLAGRVHVMNESVPDPLEAFRVINVGGTERLARSAVKAGVRRLVYVSSIKVNGEETGPDRSYDEGDAPQPADPYGVSKWEAEQMLRGVEAQAGLEVVVVRAPLVYGPGVKANFLQMLNWVAKAVPLPLASVHNSRDLVFIGNIVDALICCASHPDAAGQTYIVSDGQSMSTPYLIRSLAEGMGVRSVLLPAPPGLLRLAAKVTGKSAQLDRLLGSLRVNSNKLRQQLKWRPPFSPHDGLVETARWYLDHYGAAGRH